MKKAIKGAVVAVVVVWEMMVIAVAMAMLIDGGDGHGNGGVGVGGGGSGNDEDGGGGCVRKGSCWVNKDGRWFDSSKVLVGTEQGGGWDSREAGWW